jgi:hypothetical protein
MAVMPSLGRKGAVPLPLRNGGAELDVLPTDLYLARIPLDNLMAVSNVYE